jgi:DNA-binding MarR family transcriptional regulator
MERLSQSPVSMFIPWISFWVVADSRSTYPRARGSCRLRKARLLYGRDTVGDAAPGVQEGSPASGDHGLAPRQAQLVEQIRRVGRSVQAVPAHLAIPPELRQSDFQALVRIVTAGGLTGAELRRILGVTSSSISELADRLERSGMIARTRPRSDRRLVVLKPTPRGRRVVERALGPVVAALATVVRGLTDEELAVVHQFLDEVEHRLDEIATAR